jgi:uncharacterized membrane protein YhaH (DUF805 family)
MDKDLKQTNGTFIWKLFSFKGRISRGTWWVFSLFHGLSFVLVSDLITSSVGGGYFGEGDNTTGLVLYLIFNSVFVLFYFWILLALHVKRWHDRGYSGWCTALMFLPVVGFLIMLISLGFLEGTKGPNQYGASEGKTGEPAKQQSSETVQNPVTQNSSDDN